MSKKAMYDLRNMLCDELDELARKGELGAGDREIAHKLTDTIKNIDKIEMYGGYGRVDGYSRDEGKAYMKEQLEGMMEDPEKPAEKEALRRCMEALKRA